MIRTLIAAGLTAAASVAAAEPAACPNGVWRSDAGQSVTLVTAPTASGKTTQRYFVHDGHFGFLEEGAYTCRDGQLAASDGAAFTRVALRETPARFERDGVMFAGLLIEPETATAQTPLVVMVHGSEDTGWIGYQHMPYTLAGHGVATFQFDKRGTGGSTGSYSQNFPDLADDVIAASAEARRISEGRYQRFGLFGASQGGWIAPLAALTLQPDFVAVGFGLVASPLEEDSEQVAEELRAAGYHDETLAEAKQVTDATGAVIASNFTKGYEALAAVKARFADRPWLATIKGEFTGAILKATEAELREEGPKNTRSPGLIWDYDSVPVLRQLTMPQLWVLAAEDREAPGRLTEDRLAMLRREGVPIEVIVFPNTDHGMYEFTQKPDGTRERTRVTEGYFRLLADWMKGESHPPYGAGAPLP